MRTILIAVCMFLMLPTIIWTVPATAEDWPTYMHDATRVGHTRENLPANLVERWTIAASAAPKRAWPGPQGEVIENLKLMHRVRFDDAIHVTIVGQRVYFGSSVDHRVVCVDAETGKEVWSYFTDAAIRLAPTVAQGRVYVGSDDGFVYCLDAERGEQLWKLQAGPRDERVLARGQMISRWPVRTSVLVDDGIAYFGAGVFPHDLIYLYAVNAETGEVKWRSDSISEYRPNGNSLTPQGYLLANDETLFVASGRTLPAAVDRATGRLLHKTSPNAKQQGGTQLLLADDEVLSVSEHSILSLNQREGGIVGRFNARQITMDDSVAYLTTGSEISAVDFAQYTSAGRDGATARKAAELKRRLFSHPVYRFRELIKRLEDRLENPISDSEQQAATESTPPDGAETPEAIPNAPEEIKARLASVRKQLEASRDEYQSLRKEFESLVGINWRVASPHQSALILAGETVVVGGHGKVVARNAGDGIVRWQADVEGEVRGLAAANGNLVVSTTAGKIYCYATPAEPADVAKATPVVDRAPDAGPFPLDEWTARYAEAAEDILNRTGVRRGFCLVLGSGEGRLAYELAKRSKLQIYAVEADASLVAKSREALEDANLYGTRVIVHHFKDGDLPYANYFANLIVSDSLLRTGKVGGDPAQIVRHLKPVGGVICLGKSRIAESSVVDIDGAAQEWLTDTKLSEEGAIAGSEDGWHTLTRGVLPGAGVWTHQYGNPGNTSSSADRRIRGGLRVLWYGDPGPSPMLNRHVGGVAPLSVGGRMFVQGDETVMAYDAYNGLFLWEHENPGAIRTGVYRNHEPGNMAASKVSLFNAAGDDCTQYDAATGEVMHVYSIPDASEGDDIYWGYLGYHNGRLFGTSTYRDLLPEEERRRGRPARTTSTDTIFAFDTTTGERLWVYRGKNISHATVAVDGDRVFFIDSTLSPEQREALLREDKSELAKLTGKQRQAAEERLKRQDARLAVAIDAASGEQLWAKPVDVTDCTGVGIGAGRLVLMVQDGHIVLCGANANGHFWDQFLTGDFNRRRLVVLSADSGEKVWAKDANYRHRPIILGEQIIAEPWAFNLADGVQIMRSHPLTGEQSPWKFIRPGHHCGAITGSPHMLFYRSQVTAFYDLEADNGTQHFGGHRTGCWVNSVPAGGLLLVPESSAGCACAFSLTSTIVFEPADTSTSWGIFTAEGAARPVRHLALNLGAPGDQRDQRGQLWLSYPRPRSREGVDLPYEIEPLFAPGGGFVRANSQTQTVAGTDVPWAFVSGVRGLTRCKLPLLDEGQSPATYTVRLSFVAHAEQTDRPAPCDIKIQGETVAQNLDVAAEAGGTDQALVREFRDIRVTDDLILEIAANGAAEDGSRWPTLCAIEVIRTDRGAGGEAADASP